MVYQKILLPSFIVALLSLSSCTSGISQVSSAPASDIKAESTSIVSSSSASSSSAASPISGSSDTKVQPFGASIEKLCEIAFKYYSNTDYDNAIRVCDQIIAQAPQTYTAYNIKGVALCFEHKFSEGMPLIQKALQIKPDDAYSRFNMAMGYKLQKDYGNALKWFNNALAVKPNDAWTYYGISTIYADQGQVSQSLQYLKKAVELDASVKPVAKRQDHFAKMRENPDFIRIVS